MAAIDGIERIRFTTSHPLNFGERLVRAYADVPKLATFLHLPVQSGSDRILSLMRRGYTALEYKQKIRQLREVRPGISVSSDFIVGFPGETDADFEATMNLIAEVGFDQSFSFIYSPRPGTPAADFPDQVPRGGEAPAPGNPAGPRQCPGPGHQPRAWSARSQRVLVQGPSKKDPRQLAGRTENNRWVNFDGERSLVGQFVDVDDHRGASQTRCAGGLHTARRRRLTGCARAHIEYRHRNRRNWCWSRRTTACSPISAGSATSTCARSSSGSASRSATGAIISA